MDCEILNKVCYLINEHDKENSISIKNGELKYSKYHINNEARNYLNSLELLGQRPPPLETSTFFNILKLIYMNFPYKNKNKPLFERDVKDIYRLLCICYYYNSLTQFTEVTKLGDLDMAALINPLNVKEEKFTVDDTNCILYENKRITFNNNCDARINDIKHFREIITLILNVCNEIINVESQNVFKNENEKEIHKDVLNKIVYSLVLGDKNLSVLSLNPTVGNLIPIIIYAYKILWFGCVSNFTLEK